MIIVPICEIICPWNQRATDSHESPHYRFPLKILHKVCCHRISRVLYLRTEDVETRTSGAGHVVVEAYIHELSKWVMFDPQMNLYVSSGKTPLNAMEIKSNMALNKKLSIHSSNLLFFLLRRFYLKWILKYLSYLVADQVQCYPSQYPRVQYVLKDTNLKMFTKFQGTDINEDLIEVPYENFYPIYSQ